MRVRYNIVPLKQSKTKLPETCPKPVGGEGKKEPLETEKDSKGKVGPPAKEHQRRLSEDEAAENRQRLWKHGESDNKSGVRWPNVPAIKERFPAWSAENSRHSHQVALE